MLRSLPGSHSQPETSSILPTPFQHGLRILGCGGTKPLSQLRSSRPQGIRESGRFDRASEICYLHGIAWKPYSNKAMDRFRQIGVVALLLLLCLTPAMTCLIPGATMTAQERACCRSMGARCGQPDMPASHSCCKGTPPVIGEKAVDGQSAAIHLSAVAAFSPSMWDRMISALPVYVRIGYEDFSPPGSPPTQISVLRI